MDAGRIPFDSAVHPQTEMDPFDIDVLGRDTGAGWKHELLGMIDKRMQQMVHRSVLFDIGWSLTCPVPRQGITSIVLMVISG